MTQVSPQPSYRSDGTISPFVIRPGRSSLRSTFQLVADVFVRQGESSDAVFAGAARVILNWLAAKFPQNLPKQATDLEDFDLDHHGQQQLSCISLPEDGLWSARLLHPDAPFRNRPAVAGRTWTTELSLNRQANQVRFAVRVLCASAPYANEPIALSRPRIVLDLAMQFGLQEIRLLNGRPWMLETDGDLNAFYDLLMDDRRTLPVILLTQPDKRQWQIKLADYMLDPNLLAGRSQGLAHVVCMPMALGFEWTKMVGKAWSAFHGAVRTYYPRISLIDDAPYAHPAVLADRIVFWRYNDQEGESGFASFLLDKIAEYTAAKSVEWGGCIFFADARARRAALARERLKQEFHQQLSVGETAALRTQIDALQAAHEEEVEALRAKILEAEKDVEEFNDLAEQYKKDAERFEREGNSLRAQNDVLRNAVEAKTGRSSDSESTMPSTFDDLSDWVEEQLAGRLAFHPRAVQSVKKAVYEDVKTVCRCLLLLAREYRNMRMGYDGAKTDWETGLKRLELRFGGSITRERAGEQGETYFVRYPIGSNQRQLLEFHLRRGSTKDDRYCLAIYFFWDDTSNRVVVGWLPSHLDTRAT